MQLSRARRQLAGLLIILLWTAFLVPQPAHASAAGPESQTAAAPAPEARAGRAASAPKEVKSAAEPSRAQRRDEPSAMLKLDDSPSVRVPAATVYAAQFTPGVPQTVTIAGRGGVPAAGAGSVVLALTSTSATRNGSLVVRPAGDPGPRLPVLSLTTGAATSAEATVKLGRDGAIVLDVSAPAAIQIQVIGWYPEGDSIFPVDPTMLVGSRATGRSVAAGKPLVVDLPAQAAVPAGGTSAALVNLAVNSKKTGTLTLQPVGAGVAVPISFSAGQYRSLQILVPVSESGRISMKSSAPVAVRAELVAWTPQGVRMPSTASGPVSTGGDSGVSVTSRAVSVKVAGRAGVPASGAGVVGLAVTTSGASRSGQLTLSTGTDLAAAPLRFTKGPASSQVVDAPLSSSGTVTLRASAGVRVRVAVVSWQPKGSGDFNTLDVPASTRLLGPGDVAGGVPLVVEGVLAYALTTTASADLVGPSMHVAVGATPDNPSGIVAEVEQASDLPGGGQELTLRLAPLEEAFSGMDVSFSGAATPLLKYHTTDGPVFARARGVVGRRSPLGLDCEDSKKFLRLNASLTMDVHAKFDIFDLSFGIGRPAKFQMKASFGGGLTGSIEGGLSVSCKKQGPVLIRWSVPSPIGPIALDARPALQIDGTVDGLNMEFKGSVDAIIDVRYEDGKWSFDGNGFDGSWDPPKVSSLRRPDGQIVASLGAKFEAKIWGVVGIGIFAGPELTLSAESEEADYYCKIQLAAVARLSVEADFFVAKASADFASVASGSLSFDIGLCGSIPPPHITTTSLQGGFTGLAYSQALTEDDGTGPFRWSATGLPPGLQVSGSYLSGTPTQAGAYNPAITVTDKFGRKATTSLPLTVVNPSEESTRLIGKLARTPDGAAWYVDKRGGRHAVPDGGTYECLAAQGITPVDATYDGVNGLPPYEPAQCVRAERGDLISTKNGDAYLINDDWSRSWVTTGTTYECLRLNGADVVEDVPRYYVMDLPQGPDKTWSCLDVAASRGHLVRAGDGTSWYVDKRGDRHWVPNGGTFECLDQQGKTPMAYVVPRWLVSSLGTEYEAARCVRAAPGDIIRTPKGDSYLIRGDWTRGWIPDGGSYLCLEANGHQVVKDVPRYYVEDLTQGPDATMSCYDPAGVRGKVVRGSDGKSWYVDKRGGKHWIPNGGTYECLEAQVGAWRDVVPAGWLDQPTYEDAKCVRAEPGDIIRHVDRDAYLVNADWTRSWIPDGGTFECLRANGHEVVDEVPRYYIDDLTQSADASFSCYDADRVNGKAVRASDGSSWYVDKRGGRHWIPNGGTYECIAAQAGAWPHVVPVDWLKQPTYEDAKCVRARPGDIIRHSDGDAYLIKDDWTRGWIPTAPSYTCLRADGHAVVDDVPRYYIMDLTQSGDATFPGDKCIVRRSDGAAYFVNNESKREWIPDTPTWDCEVGRGVRVITAPDGFVNGIPETGWHYCLNKGSLHNKVLRHADGDAHYIHPDDTRTWIPDEFTYNCRTRQGRPVVETRWREYVNAFRETGWDYCFDINTFKGKLIRHPDGDVHFVGSDGRRHWVPGDRYNCMVARYGEPATVRWREYINRISEGDWAVCGDTLYRNQKLDRGQYLSSGNGRYALHMQTDGNLVLYRTSPWRAIWATNQGGHHLMLHSPGTYNTCLAEVNDSGGWVWRAGCGGGGDRLVVQGDGNLVLYAGSRAVWATNTVGR